MSKWQGLNKLVVLGVVTAVLSFGCAKDDEKKVASSPGNTSSSIYTSAKSAYNSCVAKLGGSNSMYGGSACDNVGSYYIESIGQYKSRNYNGGYWGNTNSTDDKKLVDEYFRWMSENKIPKEDVQQMIDQWKSLASQGSQYNNQYNNQNYWNQNQGYYNPNQYQNQNWNSGYYNPYYGGFGAGAGFYIWL